MSEAGFMRAAQTRAWAYPCPCARGVEPYGCRDFALFCPDFSLFSLEFFSFFSWILPLTQTLMIIRKCQPQPCHGGRYAYEHEPNFIFSSLPKLSPATLSLKDKDLDKQQDVMEKPCFQLQNTKQSKHKPKAGLSLKIFIFDRESLPSAWSFLGKLVEG